MKQDSGMLIVVYMYGIVCYTLFWNNSSLSHNERPFGGTTVYSGTDYYPGYPYNFNPNGVDWNDCTKINDKFHI